jgi:hypothetical protein
MKNIDLLLTLFANPKTALETISRERRVLFPLLFVLLSAFLATVAYFSVVDIAWLADHAVSSSARAASLTDAQRAKSVAMMSRQVLFTSSIVVVIIGIPLLRLIEATYYYLAGRIFGAGNGFREWLSLACWSSVPTIIPSLLSAGLLFLHPNGQVTQEQLNAISLNEVFLHLDPTNRFYGVASTFTLLHPICWIIVLLGVRQWLSRSWLFAAIYSVVPWTVALIALMII